MRMCRIIDELKYKLNVLKLKKENNEILIKKIHIEKQINKLRKIMLKKI